MLSPADSLPAAALDDVTGGIFLPNIMLPCLVMPWMCRGPFPLEIIPIPYPLQTTRA